MDNVNQNLYRRSWLSISLNLPFPPHTHRRTDACTLRCPSFEQSQITRASLYYKDQYFIRMCQVYTVLWFIHILTDLYSC